MIIGAIKISHALSIRECPDPWAFGPICNVIEAVCLLAQPVPHKGALSLWNIQEDARANVREQLAAATIMTNNISDLIPPLTMPMGCGASQEPPHTLLQTPASLAQAIEDADDVLMSEVTKDVAQSPPPLLHDEIGELLAARPKHAASLLPMQARGEAEIYAAKDTGVPGGEPLRQLAAHWGLQVPGAGASSADVAGAGAAGAGEPPSALAPPSSALASPPRALTGADNSALDTARLLLLPFKTGGICTPRALTGADNSAVDTAGDATPAAEPPSALAPPSSALASPPRALTGADNSAVDTAGDAAAAAEPPSALAPPSSALASPPRALTGADNSAVDTAGDAAPAAEPPSALAPPSSVLASPPRALTGADNSAVDTAGDAAAAAEPPSALAPPSSALASPPRAGLPPRKRRLGVEMDFSPGRSAMPTPSWVPALPSHTASDGSNKVSDAESEADAKAANAAEVLSRPHHGAAADSDASETTAEEGKPRDGYDILAIHEIEIAAREARSKHVSSWDLPLTLFCIERPDKKGFANIYVHLEDSSLDSKQWSMGDSTYTRLGIKRVMAANANILARVGFTCKIVAGWAVDMVHDKLFRQPMTSAGLGVNAIMGIRSASKESGITAVVSHGRVSMLAEKMTHVRGGSLADVSEEEMSAYPGGVCTSQEAHKLLDQWFEKHSSPRGLKAFVGAPLNVVFFGVEAFQGTEDSPLLLSKQLEMYKYAKVPTPKRSRSNSPAARSMSPIVNPGRDAKRRTLTEKRALEAQAEMKSEEEKRLERKRKLLERKAAAEAEEAAQAQLAKKLAEERARQAAQEAEVRQAKAAQVKKEAQAKAAQEKKEAQAKQEQEKKEAQAKQQEQEKKEAQAKQAKQEAQAVHCAVWIPATSSFPDPCR